MYLRMLQGMAGRLFSFQAGDIVEVGKDVGGAWVGAGIGEDAGKSDDVKAKSRKFKPDDTNYNEAIEKNVRDEAKTIKSQAERTEKEAAA